MKMFLAVIDFKTVWSNTLYLSKHLYNKSHTKTHSEFGIYNEFIS